MEGQFDSITDGIFPIHGTVSYTEPVHNAPAITAGYGIGRPVKTGSTDFNLVYYQLGSAFC